jgi:hypothetical protein
MSRVQWVYRDRTCFAFAGPRCANTGPAYLPHARRCRVFLSPLPPPSMRGREILHNGFTSLSRPGLPLPRTHRAPFYGIYKYIP